MGCGEEGWKMGGGDIDLRDWFAIWGGCSWAHPYGKAHWPPPPSHLGLRPAHACFTYFLSLTSFTVTSREMNQIYFFIIIKLLNTY